MTVDSILQFLEARDPRTALHSKKVVILAEQVAAILDLDYILAYKAGLLHDIGKMDLPHDVLYSNRRLSKEEFEIIKRHPIVGSQMISRLGLRKEISIVALEHHERLDGSGYPYKKRRINIYSQIVAACDIYDAMTELRTYRKKSFTIDEAIEEIKQVKACKVDIVHALERAIKEAEIQKQIEALNSKVKSLTI